MIPARSRAAAASSALLRASSLRRRRNGSAAPSSPPTAAAGPAVDPAIGRRRKSAVSAATPSTCHPSPAPSSPGRDGGGPTLRPPPPPPSRRGPRGRAGVVGPDLIAASAPMLRAGYASVDAARALAAPIRTGATAAGGRRPAAAVSRSRSASSSAAAAAAADDETEGPGLDPVPAPPCALGRRSGVRNVAVVAHVDHGKTTLVDELLKTSASSGAVGVGTAEEGGGGGSGGDVSADLDLNLDRLMDSGELERERGITITSKVTRLDYVPTDGTSSVVVNVVDTPGHADFAGEVDRVLSMVDGVVLVVDAAEGPKSQTKYVLGRALGLGLRPLCVLNKADRSDAASRIESGETETELLDLFDGLGADEVQMDYRTLYASARGGWCTEDVDLALAISEGGGATGDAGADVGMRTLLDAVLEDIPPPAVHSYAGEGGGDASPAEDDDEDAARPADAYGSDPFSMAATTVGYDQYLGRTCTGRVYSGRIATGEPVLLLRRDGGDDGDASAYADGAIPPPGHSSKVAGLFVNRGASRTPLEPAVAYAGDIVTIAGVPEATGVGDTVTSAERPVPAPIDTPPLAPPTLSCVFGANDGPLAGREGDVVASSSSIRARLTSETDNNVTMAVAVSETDAEKTVVYGRGELQIGILIEQMRREGYEMVVAPPHIVSRTCPDTGAALEPHEELVVDVDAEYSGAVIDSLTGARRGVLMEMHDDASDGKTRMVFEIPSRSLLGLTSEMATSTRGTAVMHHCYLEDREISGPAGTGLERGKMVSNASGKATLYALSALAERGTLFVAPGDEVYPGMVVGESSRGNDMDVNPVRAKATTNMRTQLKDDKMYLAPPRRMTVEELIGYMDEDELIEVTPKSIRLRKVEMDAGVRQRLARAKKRRRDALREQQQQKKKGK